MKTQQGRYSLDGLKSQLSKNSRARQAGLLATALPPMIFLWGCAGLVSGQNAQPQNPQQPQTYSVSGAITPAAAGSGTTLTLSGAGTGTTTADASGNFTFTGVANGTYAITPSHAGYSFSPTSLSVTVNGANVATGLNFTATAQSYSISGTISPTAGGNGATVTLSGAANAKTTANSSGAYTFNGLVNGTYTVTPSQTGYTFNPTSQNVTINGASAGNVNFTATAVVGQTFTISGTISPTAGGSGAIVTLGGTASGTTTANTSGAYSFTGLANGSYTVTPSNTGYTFTPPSQTVTVNGANVGSVNFTATATTQSHSASLSWLASSSVVAGYNVYRGTVNGGPYTLVNTSLITGLSFTDASVQAGQTYYYVAAAIDGSGNESVYSNQVTAVIP